MPSQAQIADKIFRGQLLQANLTKTIIANETAGFTGGSWKKIYCLSELLAAMETQFLIPDYTSTTTVTLYNRLSKTVGLQYIDGAPLDPGAQQTPGVIYVGNNPEAQNYRPSFDITIATQGCDSTNDQFIDTTIAGLTYQVFANSVNRYATFALDGFQILPSGGFSFDPTKFILYPGDVLIVIF